MVSLFTEISSLSEADRQRVKEWIDANRPVVAALESKRSEELQKLPLAAFRDVKQLDFTKMDFSHAEMVERINALANPTIINLKNCMVSDDEIAQMKLSASLKKIHHALKQGFHQCLYLRRSWFFAGSIESSLVKLRCMLPCSMKKSFVREFQLSAIVDI